MSSSSMLFDTEGRLLPPEKCNIKPLVSLTKNRARSPSNRSPSRNGRQSAGNERNPSPKLPNFVQEVTGYSETRNIRLASPTAIKAHSSAVKLERTSTNSLFDDVIKHLKDISVNPSRQELKLSRLSEPKLQRKMLSGTSNGDAKDIELSEKPVSTWSVEDVCVWLECIGLSNFKESFISQSVTGKTLLNLNYETLEKLNLSNTSQEREHFLAEVYNLQQDVGQGDDEREMDREIEETLLGIDSHEDNNTHSMVFVSATSELLSSDSFASSSRTGSDIGSTPTKEMLDDVGGRDEEISCSGSLTLLVGPNSTSSQPRNHSGTNSQILPSQAKSRKDSAKQPSKKSKPRTRLSRLFNSFHQSHKDPSLLHTAPPIYKNAFHNLMNTGPQGVIKIWTEMFLTDMQYVSLLVKHESTAFDVVKMVLEKSNAQEDPECYRICEINEQKEEYVLDRNECPLQRERQWSDPDNCRFELRWRNERLIEWSNSSDSIAQHLTEQKNGKNSPPDKLVENDNKTSPLSSDAMSDTSSPSLKDTSGGTLETEFAYIVETQPERSPKTVVGVQNIGFSDFDVPPPKTMNSPESVPMQNYLNSENFEEQESLKAASARLTSSCPDLSSNDLLDGVPEFGNLLISKNSIFMNAESDLVSAMRDDERQVNELSSRDAEDSSVVGEFEYSQQLRRSSKRLSDRLRLGRTLAKVEGPAVEIGINRDDVEVAGDKPDGKGHEESETNLAEESVKNTQIVEVDEKRHESSANASEGLENETPLDESADVDLSKSPGYEELASAPVMLPEVGEVLQKIKEIQKENEDLVEENRELKKMCRTFEGKSRLKERELEDLEEAKRELDTQVQEMVVELHSLRAENTELRAEVAEANTKLSDVDGWVTRDVFEDIRGQLSVSLEEVETREEKILEVEQKCKELNLENKKMKEVEVENEELKKKVREGKEVRKEMEKEQKDMRKQILELEVETQNLQKSLEEKENEKLSLEQKIREVEAEQEGLKKTSAEEKKDLQKRISDKEYEILIMKEEKKELCVKMKSFEGNVETLREEMKKKDGDHEAAIAEMEKQSAIKDESLSVTVSNLEQLVNERDTRIKQLKNQIALSGAPQSELQAKAHEYEQNKVYLKHLIALVREKDPSLLDVLNQTLSSRDSEDWC